MLTGCFRVQRLLLRGVGGSPRFLYSGLVTPAAAPLPSQPPPSRVSPCAYLHDGPANRGRRVLASVDPGVEEHFVFLEFAAPVEDGRRQGWQAVAKVEPSGEELRLPGAHHARSRRVATDESRRRGAHEAQTGTGSDADFVDVKFQLPAKKSPRKQTKGKREHEACGGVGADESVPVSDRRCSGCGAVLHCTDPGIPGHLPREKYARLLSEDTLDRAVCQRCHLLVHHNRALQAEVSADDFTRIAATIRPRPALVLHIVDLLDLPGSIVPDLTDLVGRNKHIFVLGNKVDLLPGDATGYLKRLRRQLERYCAECGLSADAGLKGVHLISAKTGYGVEPLISSIQSSWKYRGDAYLLGFTNAGKSTLFNALLESDYCKSKASDVIGRATISPWPGTTLNLLKSPIINPTPYRMFRRAERLGREARLVEEDFDDDDEEQRKRLKQLKNKGYLVGKVGRTFRADSSGRQLVDIDFNPDELCVDFEQGGLDAEEEPSEKVGFTHNELKDAHWLYDTPGIVKDHCVLNLLTEQEVKMAVPSQCIVPRTFILKPGMVLFLGGLGRVDYIKGQNSCWLSVVASNQLPVHISRLERAEELYAKHAGKTTLLGVPTGGAERMQQFPALEPHDVEVDGLGPREAAADIQLFSAGWVAVTAAATEKMLFRVHTPAGTTPGLRRPPLLPYIVTLKGERIRKTPAYKALKPEAPAEVKRPRR